MTIFISVSYAGKAAKSPLWGEMYDKKIVVLKNIINVKVLYYFISIIENTNSRCSLTGYSFFSGCMNYKKVL